MQATATADKAVHMAVKHAAVKAARAVQSNVILKVFTDKRKSQHNSNIAGRQIKIWLFDEKRFVDVYKAIQQAVAPFNCRLACVPSVNRGVRLHKYMYLQVIRK